MSSEDLKKLVDNRDYFCGKLELFAYLKKYGLDEAPSSAVEAEPVTLTNV